MSPDMQWRDDEDGDWGPVPASTGWALVAECGLVLFLFVPIIWLALAVSETFR